jgi:hypothetical protein
MTKQTLKSAREIGGKVTDANGKLPGTSYPITAYECKVGSKLALIEGSVCHSCYAKRLEAFRPSVHQGWTANYTKAVNGIASDPRGWALSVAFQSGP